MRPEGYQGEIEFHFEEVEIDWLNTNTTAEWIRKVLEEEGAIPGNITVIFCTDNYLRDINKKYLDHNYYTDIITFDYTEELGDISGDIFISVDRVKENSMKYRVSQEEELFRVIVHGLLHLLDYKDVGEEEKAQMRAKENYYLSLLSI